MASRVLVALRVAASPERAFAAFTEEIGMWWRPNSRFPFTPRGPGQLAFEPGPSCRLTERQPDGDVFEIGRITVWRPPSDSYAGTPSGGRNCWASTSRGS